VTSAAAVANANICLFMASPFPLASIDSNPGGLSMDDFTSGLND
jgi:hypothetical protein